MTGRLGLAKIFRLRRIQFDNKSSLAKPKLLSRSCLSPDGLARLIETIDEHPQTFIVPSSLLPDMQKTLAPTDKSTEDSSRLGIEQNSCDDAVVTDIDETIGFTDLASIISMPTAQDLCLRQPFVSNRTGRIETPLSEEDAQLFEAVTKSDIHLIQHIKSNGANFNTRHPKHGGTVLHIAAAKHLPAKDTQELLGAIMKGRKGGKGGAVRESADVNVNARAFNGSTPLHWACGTGAIHAVEALLELGADPTITTYTWAQQVFGRGSGQTAAHWAAESGHSHAVQAVINKWAAAPLAVDERDQTPKALAIKEGFSHVQSLLECFEQQKFVCIEIKCEATAVKFLDQNISPTSPTNVQVCIEQPK